MEEQTSKELHKAFRSHCPSANISSCDLSCCASCAIQPALSRLQAFTTRTAPHCPQANQLKDLAAHPPPADDAVRGPPCGASLVPSASAQLAKAVYQAVQRLVAMTQMKQVWARGPSMCGGAKVELGVQYAANWWSLWSWTRHCHLG